MGNGGFQNAATHGYFYSIAKHTRTVAPYRKTFRQGATLVPRMLCLVERKTGSLQKCAMPG